jgi:hypothetical protein
MCDPCRTFRGLVGGMGRVNGRMGLRWLSFMI